MFWGSTLREVVREVALAREARDVEYDRDIRLAWYVVRIYAEARTKRLPTLKSLLTKGGKPERRQQSVDEQRRVLQTLAHMYGGRVRQTKPRPHGE